MAQRWPAPKVQPKLTQEEFDEAVKTNIEDFDMSASEAVKSAVEEFTLQGYDLSCVVKTSAGGDLAQHDITLATQALVDAGADPELVGQACAHLHSLVEEAVSKGPSACQEMCAVALKASTLAALISSLTAITQISDIFTPMSTTKIILTTARNLMAGSVDMRDAFIQLGGVRLLLALHTTHTHDLDLQADVAQLAACACFKNEAGKEAVMEAGYPMGLLVVLATHNSSSSSAPLTTTPQASDSGNADSAAGSKVSCTDSTAQVISSDASAAALGAGHQCEGAHQIGSLPARLVVAACGVLKSVTTADDDRPVGSKAFMHARLLARQHQALKVLLALLQQLDGAEQASTAAAVLATVKQLAANEEICRDFSDEGGVTTCMMLLNTLAGVSREAVQCGLGALRQLAHSDITKRLLSDRGGAQLLMKLASAYAGNKEVVEPAVGLMANMTLRQPDVVHACAEAGVIEWVLEVMADMPGSRGVQRSGCILIRNMVVRTTEYRQQFLDKGAEALLRAAKKRHPKSCSDVGSAALRDLGLDNYGTMEEFCVGNAAEGEYSD